MPRAISADGLRELFAQNSGHALLVLATFDHPDLPEPIRLVNDVQGLDYDGHAYIGLPFEASMPTDAEDDIPTVQMRVDNVDQTLIELLRSISAPADVVLEVVRVAPNRVITTEIGPLDFSLLDSRATDTTVTLKIGYLIDLLNAQATSEIFSSSLAPGLFK